MRFRATWAATFDFFAFEWMAIDSATNSKERRIPPIVSIWRHFIQIILSPLKAFCYFQTILCSLINKSTTQLYVLCNAMPAHQVQSVIKTPHWVACFGGATVPFGSLIRIVLSAQSIVFHLAHPGHCLSEARFSASLGQVFRQLVIVVLRCVDPKRAGNRVDDTHLYLASEHFPTSILWVENSKLFF